MERKRTSGCAGLLTAEQIGILADHKSALRGIVGHGQTRVQRGKPVVAGTIAPPTEGASRS